MKKTAANVAARRDIKVRTKKAQAAPPTAPAKPKQMRKFTSTFEVSIEAPNVNRAIVVFQKMTDAMAKSATDARASVQPGHILENGQEVDYNEGQQMFGE